MTEQRYLTVEEVATELRVSTDTVLRLIKRKELGAVKVGVKYRISVEEYERYKDAQRTDKPEEK
jgi:excisionase family DNA binding protein